MTERNKQVARIFIVLQILDSARRGLTINELLARLEDRGHDVNLRTVYRDLEALQQAGFPLRVDSHSDTNGARWVLDPTCRVQDYLPLSAVEILALFMARGTMKSLATTPFYKSLESAFDKLEAKMGTASSAYFSELRGTIQFRPGPTWTSATQTGIFETVHAACAERHQLAITYHSVRSQKTSDRVVGPHSLYFADSGFYLLADDLTDGECKSFALPRIEKATMLEALYEGRTLEPDAHLRDVIGAFVNGSAPETIRLAFSHELARFAQERTWHPSQRVVTNKDGTVDLIFSVALTPKLVCWILGFGPYVKVLTPPHLRNTIKSEAQKIARLYGSKKSA